MKKYGLVLAGGGGKGAYQLGAWKALSEMGIEFEAIAGVSIGSINGALIAAGDYEKAVEMWKSVSVDKGIKITEVLPDSENLFSRKNWGALFKEFLKNGGIDASPMVSFLSQYINEEKIRQSAVPFGIITVQMTQGVTPLELFIDDIPEGTLIDYLLASSNVPLVTNIGPEGEKFLDGGVYDNIPVTTLKKRGFNKLIIIDISNIKGVSHSLDIFNSEIVYIRPYDIDDLGQTFDFDEEITNKRITLGYLDARKAFSFLLGKIYYFEPEVFRGMVKEYGADALQNLEEFAEFLKLDKAKVYTQQGFIYELKLLYEQSKLEEAEKQQQQQNAQESEGFKFSFLKRFTQKKNFDDFQDAIAVLENYVI